MKTYDEEKSVSINQAGKNGQNDELLTCAQKRIICNVSHDLKSPIVAVGGLAGIVRRDIELHAPEQRRWIDILVKVEKAAENTLDLIGDMLTTSRIEAGSEETIDLHLEHAFGQELEEITDIFRFEAEAKGVELSLDIQTPLPATMMDIKNMRYRVINNLVSNALKFTPKGGSVQLSASSDENWITIRVEDTGPGVPPEESEKIFDVYNQLEGGTLSAGLGLSIARHFIELHNGTICLDTAFVDGAAFEVRLPVIP